MKGLFAKLFGVSAPAARATPSVVVTATVQVRDLTSDEIATYRRHFRAAFDSIASQLVGPKASRETLFEVLWSHRDAKMAKEIAIAWPGGLTWPAGTDFLKSRPERKRRTRPGDPPPELINLAERLLLTVTLASYRVRRGLQIMEIVERTHGPKYPNVRVRSDCTDRPAPCGLTDGDERRASEIRALILGPYCGHPGCTCSFNVVMKPAK